MACNTYLEYSLVGKRVAIRSLGFLIMTTRSLFFVMCSLLANGWSGGALARAGDAAGSGSDVAPRLQAILAVGEKGQGNVAASKAWQELVKADAAALPEILAALDRASPLAANWLRGAVDAIAERELTGNGKLPTASLEKFALDTSHNPRARRLAYEWLARADKTAPDRLIPGMLNDPSTEFRRDAVARLLTQASA